MHALAAGRGVIGPGELQRMLRRIWLDHVQGRDRKMTIGVK